jgi:hypothetical protein
VNEATARKLYQDYSASCHAEGSKLTQQGFEKFVQEEHYYGRRELVRDIFKEVEQAAGREHGPGRPRNSPAKK